MATLTYLLDYTVVPNCTPVVNVKYDFYDSANGSGTLLGSINGAPADIPAGLAWIAGGSYENIQINDLPLYNAAGQNNAYMIVTITDNCNGKANYEVQITNGNPEFTVITVEVGNLVTANAGSAYELDLIANDGFKLTLDQASCAFTVAAILATQIAFSILRVIQTPGGGATATLEGTDLIVNTDPDSETLYTVWSEGGIVHFRKDAFS